MQARWSALLSGLVLGLLITLWHLPLMVTGEIHFAEVASIMTAMIVINWLFNQARGSVLVIMICHAANNAISGQLLRTDVRRRRRRPPAVAAGPHLGRDGPRRW